MIPIRETFLWAAEDECYLYKGMKDFIVDHNKAIVNNQVNRPRPSAYAR